jgi:hypothetical protein
VRLDEAGHQGGAGAVGAERWTERILRDALAESLRDVEAELVNTVGQDTKSAALGTKVPS